MMHQQERYPYFESADLQAVAMPYQSDELSLIAILPAEGKLASVEAAMNAAWFDALLAGMSDEAVQLGFPKLDYRSHLSLVPALRALGMNAAFGDADFSGMSSGELQIGDVIHEAVVRVFEGGTIAAGATAVTIRTASIIVSTHQLTLNRPFLYAIYDQPTGSILFIGRVLDPTAN
jgi:serpin B